MPKRVGTFAPTSGCACATVRQAIQGAETQVWLAVSSEPRATVNGRYFYHKRVKAAHPAASDVHVQDGLLKACEELTGVRFPPVGQTVRKTAYRTTTGDDGKRDDDEESL